VIIDGVKLAAAKEADLRQKAPPGLKLAILAFKADRAGQVYSRLKAEAGARAGIEVARFNFDWQEIKQMKAKLKELNRDNSYAGIMIQRPGYRGKEFEKYWRQLVSEIAPEKDVDGLRDDSLFVPATVKAVELLLDKFVNDRQPNYILVVGRGTIGRGLAKRLKVKNISSQDPDLVKLSLEADILISCSGKMGLIKVVKPGAVVIDVGWPKGDVDFSAVKKVAGAITPVPGGVGPITVICLLENLIEAVYNQEILNPKS